MTLTDAALSYAIRHRLHVLHHTCRWVAGRELQTSGGQPLASCLLVRSGWFTCSVERWTPKGDRHATLVSGRPATVIAWLGSH